LVEFTFERFLRNFERLDPETRNFSGSLVKRVDPNAIGQLQLELTSLSRSRRLRGLELAVILQASKEVEEQILSLSFDADHIVRVAAIHALQHSNSEQARKRLQDLRSDRAASVREAAEDALERIVPDPFAPIPSPVTDTTNVVPGVQCPTQ
jgi:hypothetical protein